MTALIILAISIGLMPFALKRETPIAALILLAVVVTIVLGVLFAAGAPLVL
jgi:hypothetical protein